MSAESRTDLIYEITYDPQFVPQRSSHINVKTTVVEGEPTYIMKNHVTGSYYSLGDLAFQVWNLIDGKRTLVEIAEEMKDVGKVLSVLAVKRSLLFFAEHGCLEAALELPKEKRVRVVSAFEIRIDLLKRSKKLLESIHRAVQPVLWRPLLWVSLAFIIVCGLVFAGRFATIFAEKSNFQILGSSVVGFFFYFSIVLIPVIMVHEIAHGLALVHYGGAPKEVGTGLFYFGPMFYINTTDAWMLPRRQRIMVFLAGPLSTLLIGSALVVVTFLVQLPAFLHQVLTMAAFFCFYMTLSNLAPPFETDGYYVLMDLVNNPYLRQEAYSYVKTLLLRKPVTEELAGLTTKKKRILLVYFFISIGWIVYLAYQTLTILLYMAQDVAIVAVDMGSAIFFGQVLTVTAAVVGVATILYFGMTVAGYGLVLATVVKKALIKALTFEAIHDRDLSLFLHLPTQVPRTLVNALKKKTADVAERFTLNYDVQHSGTQCLAVLRMGGARLAHVQIREHVRKVEEAFSSMYQSFLHDHEHEIFESIGIYPTEETQLTALLREMGAELARAGRPEARAVVHQIVERQSKTVWYLLSSAFGKVWTVELPPLQQEKLLETMLPTFYVEDLAVTDLYDETEEFKKQTIYGFDSLAQLAIQNQKAFQEILAHPDKYQVVCFFEPVKSRLLFLGRTEEIEVDLPTFGPLFLSQAWCSYMDNLLTETNYALSMLSRASIPKEDAIQAMKDGELSVLQKNLSGFVGNEQLIEASLSTAEAQPDAVANSLQELKSRLKPIGAFKVGLLDAIFEVNAENLRALPKRFAKFRNTFKNLCLHVEETRKLVEQEHQKRKPPFQKKKRKLRLTYPLVACLSAVLVITGLHFTSFPTVLPFLISPLLLHAVFLAYYLRLTRSFRSVSRYPSPAFDQIQLFVLALTQAVYTFAVTGNILTPSTIPVNNIPKKIERTKN